jgi:NMD protein affecting ribosome stability and mRNA decay
MKRFCPKCGVTISQGTLCSNCVKEKLTYKTPLVQVSEFGRVIENARWRVFDCLDEVIIKRVKEALNRKDISVELESFEFIPRAKEKTTIYAKVSFEDQELRLPVRLSYCQCDFGQKEKTGYFEGILQLRHPHEAVLNFIAKQVDGVNHKGVFISKTVEQKNGVDLYFTKKTFMKLLADKLGSRFGAKVDLNPTLFSHNHQTSKDIYRLTILVEFPEFCPEDCVMFRPVHARSIGEPVVVKIINLGKLMTAKNLLTGKHISFELKYTKDLVRLDTFISQISNTQPYLSVIHPETFQEERIVNENILKNSYEIHQEVIIVNSPYGIILVE